LFFDLDRFKLINDSLSHAAGDELLVEIAHRLKSIIRSCDTIARLGGDEFVIVIPEMSKKEDIIGIATTVLDNIKKTVNLGGHKLQVTASMGIAIYPENGKNVDELLRNADAGMYSSKARGANQFQFYSETINKENVDRLDLEAKLRHAIKNNELNLVYQPIYDIKTKLPIAVEALIRWNHPEKGIILPMDFIPLSEEIGLINDIGLWVLKEACQQNKLWQNMGLPPIRVAVNVTSQQLRQLDFVDTVKNTLKETGLKPEYLELELSENFIIKNIDHAVKVIDRLKEIGISIAVDDFGTGNSSLSYLRNLQLDRLKIDRSFLENIKNNRGNEIVVHAILAMAHGLNLEVLAEGVENQSQLTFLKEQECNKMQGFYLSRPLEPDDLTKLLKDRAVIDKETATEDKS